jgi:anti-sigma factor RsiW
MNCQQCDEQLIDFVFAELAPDPRADLVRHLAECPTCALASYRLRADLDGLSHAGEHAPPPALRARVRSAVAAEFRPPWWRRTLASGLRPVPAYGLAVAALAPILVWAAVHALTVRAPAPPAADLRPVLADYDASAPVVRPWNLL